MRPPSARLLRRSRVGVREPDVREQLLEVAQDVRVDVSLERRQQRRDRVDREARLVEVLRLELRVRELAERRHRREHEILDAQLAELLGELLRRDSRSATPTGSPAATCSA